MHHLPPFADAPACQVRYSIGLAGTFKLHVRLRHEGLPLPGSPFDLHVVPGAADGHASFLETPFTPVEGPLLRGVLRTCDVMGNACTTGGASVKVSASPSVEVNVTDQDDGCYELTWIAPRGELAMLMSGRMQR